MTKLAKIQNKQDNALRNIYFFHSIQLSMYDNEGPSERNLTCIKCLIAVNVSHFQVRVYTLLH